LAKGGSEKIYSNVEENRNPPVLKNNIRSGRKPNRNEVKVQRRLQKTTPQEQKKQEKRENTPAKPKEQT